MFYAISTLRRLDVYFHFVRATLFALPICDVNGMFSSFERRSLVRIKNVTFPWICNYIYLTCACCALAFLLVSTSRHRSSSPEGRVYWLSAETEQELGEWIDALKRAIQSVE